MAQALWGCSAEQVAPPLPILPDVWPSLQIFIDMGTQWRVGINGAIGLDYNVLPMLFDLHEVTNRRRTLGDLRKLEGIALEEIRAQQAAD